jgi:hypothetical protein
MRSDTYRAVKARGPINRLLIPTGALFPDGPDPDAYCMGTVGTCMMPEVNDGDFVIVSPARALVVGEKVAIWFKCAERPLIKRLLALPVDGGGSLVVAQLNPFRTYRAPVNEVDRVHAIAGVYTPEKHEEAVRLHREAEERKLSRPRFYVDRGGACMDVAR